MMAGAVIKPAAICVATIALVAGLAVHPGAHQTPTFTFQINNAVRYQTWRGWGGTLSVNRGLNHVPQVAMDQIIDEAVDDLGLTFVRVQDGVLSEPLNDNDDPNTINWAGFYDTAAIDLEVSRGLGRFVAKVRAKGIEPVVMLDRAPSVSSASWMNPAEAAEQILANLIYYKTKHGIDITYVPIEREPDSTSAMFQRTVINILGPKLVANGLSTKVALNEGRTAENAWSMINALKDDSSVMQHVGLFSWHGYGAADPYRALIRDAGMARGIPTGMTEHSGGQVANLIDDVLGGASYWARNTIIDAGPPAEMASQAPVATRSSMRGRRLRIPRTTILRRTQTARHSYAIRTTTPFAC